MDGTAEPSIDDETLHVDLFPDGLASGSTVLIAGAVDPAMYAVALRGLCRYGHADGAALVVTTTESAEQTLTTYETVCADSDRPSLGLVDTTSKQQYVTALFRETPVVFIPAPGDLERLVLALSELTGDRPPSKGTRHLVIRSLTPLLENASTARVCTVLERITGLRAGAGLCLLGIDYTAHDRETMAAVIKRVDGVLWITEMTRNRLEFEFRPTSSRHNRSVMDTDSDD